MEGINSLFDALTVGKPAEIDVYREGKTTYHGVCSLKKYGCVALVDFKKTNEKGESVDIQIIVTPLPVLLS